MKPETYMEGNERPKKKAGHSSLVGGGRFNKQGYLPRRLILGSHMIRSLHLTIRILDIYVEALTGISRIHHLYGVSNT